ncbi:sidestep protein, putative, partial [Ixodes scapularis]
PPEPPVIRDGAGNELRSTIGPYNEGSTLALVCVVYGGKPKPTLVWSGIPEGMMSEIRPSSEAQLTTSTLLIHALRREDLRTTLDCAASNNISSPASTSVTLDLNLRPVAVKIRRGDIPISAGLPAEIVCEVWGSRPPPVVTWWKGLQQLNHTFVYVSTDGNVTTSVVSFTPASEDHGSNLACRAKNPAMVESVEEDTWSMDVQWPPGPVENCSITNQTEGSLHLECQAGSDGHLPAHFQLSVHDAMTAALSANFTADRPDFWVHDLLPGVEYFLVVWAVNERGRSPELTILPPIMPLVGKLTKSGNTVKISSNALLVTVVSAVALLCLLPVFVLAAVKLKNKRFFVKTRETKKEVVDEDACPSTTAASPEEATQLQISSIYPKEDNQLWIVKKSTGL